MLAGYIDQGISNSPVLKDLSNQIESNRFDSLITRATYLPQIDFNASLMYAPVVNNWGYSDVITNGQQLIGTLNVNQHIFNKKTQEANYQKYGLESGVGKPRQFTENQYYLRFSSEYWFCI